MSSKVIMIVSSETEGEKEGEKEDKEVSCNIEHIEIYVWQSNGYEHKTETMGKRGIQEKGKKRTNTCIK